MKAQPIKVIGSIRTSRLSTDTCSSQDILLGGWQPFLRAEIAEVAIHEAETVAIHKAETDLMPHCFPQRQQLIMKGENKSKRNRGAELRVQDLGLYVELIMCGGRKYF